MRSGFRTARILSVLVAAIASACSESATAPVPVVITEKPATPAAPIPAAPAFVGTSSAPLALTGGGYLTEWTFESSRESLHGWGTTILAANGPLVVENDRCCRIKGDTILQINYSGVPVVGPRSMEPPQLELGGADFRHYGPDDALLMVHENLRSVFFVPVKTWILEITGYVAPEGTRLGEIRGRATFEAVALVQERKDILSPMFLTRLEGTTMVHAEFVTPMRYQFRSYKAPF